MADINNPELMVQTKNKDAYLIQFLVRNYLENENKEASVHLYGELINDIDIFTVNLERNEKMYAKFKSMKPTYQPPLTIDAFLTLKAYNEDLLMSRLCSDVGSTNAVR